MASGEAIRGEAISKSTLEEAARESTLHGHGTPEKRFWERQQGKAETIVIGKGYISKVCLLIKGCRDYLTLSRLCHLTRKRLKKNYDGTVVWFGRWSRVKLQIAGLFRVRRFRCPTLKIRKTF